MKKRLDLRRETLAELATDELTVVVGAAAPPTVPLGACVSAVPSCAQHTCFDCITRQGCTD